MRGRPFLSKWKFRKQGSSKSNKPCGAHCMAQKCEGGIKHLLPTKRTGLLSPGSPVLCRYGVWECLF